MLNNIYTYPVLWAVAFSSLSRHDAAAEGGVQEGDVVIYRLLQPQQNRGWGVGTSAMESHESHGRFSETWVKIHREEQEMPWIKWDFDWDKNSIKNWLFHENTWGSMVMTQDPTDGGT